jgi:nitrate/nitrite-specific signal transduction histidine kinase
MRAIVQQVKSGTNEIRENLTLKDFEATLQERNFNVDVKELLTRYKNQGICEDLCNNLLS